MRVKLRLSRYFFIGVILVIIAGVRLMLITKGHFHLQDELRYRYTFAFIRELTELQVAEAMRQLFQFPLYARPLLVLVNLPTALLQVAVLLITGAKTESPFSLSWASGFQVLGTIGVSLAVYVIAKKYLKSEVLALGSTVVYSLLINSNLYIRHILPYDLTLFIYLVWLYLVLQNYRRWSARRLSVASGFIAAVLHLVYPAYYLFIPIFVTLTTFLPRARRLKRFIFFIVSFVTPIAAVEFLARILGKSYFVDAQFLTTRVVVGDPGETLVFVYRYLWQVEGWVGLLLIILFSSFLVHIMVKRKLYGREFFGLTAAIVGAYLLYGLGGSGAGKVFYGRSVRMFFPFVVLGAMMVLKQTLNEPRRRLVAGLVISVSLISFIQWYPQFLRLTYPGDVLYALCQFQCTTLVSEVNENYSPDSVENHPIDKPDYVAVNFGRFFFPDKNLFDHTPENAELLWQAPHPINFTAYQFEALSPIERKLIKERNYQMKLYRLQ